MLQDMDLLNENRSLIHTGKLLRQPDTGFEWNGWTELFVLLFDNYRMLPFSIRLHAIILTRCPHSCDDKAQGEGRFHEVHCIQTSKPYLLILSLDLQGSRI